MSLFFFEVTTEIKVMTAKTQKIVGLALMAPAALLALYLGLSLKFWLLGVLVVVAVALAGVGYRLVKGVAVQDAVKEVEADAKVVADAVKNTAEEIQK